MEKKTKIIIGVSASSAVVLGLGLGLGLGLQGNHGHKVTTVKYNVINQTKSTRAGEPEHLTKVFPANLNQDALLEVNQFGDNLTVGTLQYDFNRALTDFFEIYEAKSNKMEIEIENIQVMKKNENAKSFQLKVWYEVEKSRALYSDDEQLKSTLIDWTPTLTTMTHEDICEVVETVRGYRDTDNKHGIDLEDLKELFLGEKDDGDYDFDDDDDDIGIFDKLGSINKDYDNQSSIIAYSLRVSDIFDAVINNETSGKPQAYAINPKVDNGSNVDKNTEFKIPSLSLNSGGAVVLIPNESPSFKFTSILDNATWTQLFNDPSKTTFNFTNDKELLDKVFVGSNDAWKNSVKEVTVDQNKGTVTIKYNDESQAWEEVVLARAFGLQPHA